MACISPIQIKSPYNNDKYIYVGCGRCAWCRRDKRNEWYLRFKLEQRDCTFTKFITLTYSDDNMPFYLDEDTGEYGYRANKSHIQKFIKRMRKAGFVFKYFIVSEYAPDTQRPHYHGLLFTDQDIEDTDIREHWKFGITDTQEADEGCLNYVTKYILKGNDRDGNFKLQSVKPAIGKGYIKQANALQCYVYDEENDIMKWQLPINGQLLPLPRYYKKKFAQFFDDYEFKMNKCKVVRKMEKDEKFAYLKQKYYEKDDTTSDVLERDQRFIASIRYKYNKDNQKQYDINNKKFEKYDT